MKAYRSKTWVLVTLAYVALACLSGCSTVAGVGKDIQGVAEWSKDKMTGKDSK
jgi:predicted small secreted protein